MEERAVKNRGDTYDDPPGVEQPGGRAWTGLVDIEERKREFVAGKQRNRRLAPPDLRLSEDSQKSTNNIGERRPEGDDNIAGVVDDNERRRRLRTMVPEETRAGLGLGSTPKGGDNCKAVSTAPGRTPVTWPPVRDEVPVTCS